MLAVLTWNRADMQVLPLPGFVEPVSALTHLLGALVFAVLSISLLRRARGDARRVALLGVYAFACVLLLAMSGVYHMLPEESLGRAVMGRLDKAAIFVLIAGTHTPVQGLFFRGVARWGVLLALWLIAVAGITFFTVYYDALPGGLGTSIYLLLGWVAGASGVLVWRRIGTARIAPLVLGGLAYSVGAIVQWLRWPSLAPGVFGAHELWHLAVLAGMGLHWAFLFQNAGRSLDG
jgi:channel protein (hemolysin III family)